METIENIKVVIVDDSPLIRLAVSKAVVDCGFDLLFTADNGSDLLDKLDGADSKPDVCLMDVDMPIVDGYEATTLIKSKWPSIEVLAHTSNDDDDVLVRMLKCGADGYILKGCSKNEIREAVRQIFKNGHYFNEWTCRHILQFLRRNPQTI